MENTQEAYKNGKKVGMMKAATIQIEIVEIACSTCGTPIFMSVESEKALRSSGKIFHCLSGHALCFSNPDGKDKLTLSKQSQHLVHFS